MFVPFINSTNFFKQTDLYLPNSITIVITDFDEKEIGYDNIISMCDDAMKLQSAIDDILVENIQTQSSDKSKSNITPQLITGEKNLLLLSSYPDCTEGILYTMPLLYKKNNRTVLFVRYSMLILALVTIDFEYVWL